jgi:hypothetical protein
MRSSVVTGTYYCVVKTVYLKGVLFLCFISLTVHTTADSCSLVRDYEEAGFWNVMSCGLKEIY